MWMSPSFVPDRGTVREFLFFEMVAEKPLYLGTDQTVPDNTQDKQQQYCMQG